MPANWKMTCVQACWHAMPPIENDPSKPIGPATGPQPEASAASGSNAEAEGSAAHIAELVRRTSERDASADATSAAPTEVTVPERVAPTPTPPDPTATLPTATTSAPAAAPPEAPARTASAPTETLPVVTAPVATAPVATAPVATAPAIVPPAPQPGVPRARPSLSRPSVRFLVVGGVIAAVLIGGGLAFAGQGDSEARKAPAAAAAAPAPAPAPAPAAPAGYAVQKTDEITDCERHAHGRIKTTFRRQNCVTATRTLGSGRVDGRPVLFVTARIEMETDAAATSIRRVLDGTGTGNLNDLLREGKTFPGAPGKMPGSGYASARTDAVVLVAEAGFSDGGPSSNDDPALREAAAKVAAMLKAQG